MPEINKNNHTSKTVSKTVCDDILDTSEKILKNNEIIIKSNNTLMTNNQELIEMNNELIAMVNENMRNQSKFHMFLIFSIIMSGFFILLSKLI